MRGDDDRTDAGWPDGQSNPPPLRRPPGQSGRTWVLQNVDRLGIDWDSLPRTPFWAPLFGKGNEWYRLNVAAKVMGLSALVRRELTREEKDAISYHAAKECRTRAMESPWTLAATLYFERRGRAAMRFPFWTPKPTTINPDVFPSQRLAFLRGAMASASWNALRFGCYWFICHSALSGLFSSYSMSVWMANIRLDPRLEDIHKAVATRRPGGQRIGGPGGSQEAAPAAWQAQSRNEDMSMRDVPTPFPGDEPTDAPAGGDQAQHGAYPRPGQRRPPQGTPQPSPEPAPQSWDDEPFVFDDASPVAPSERGKSAGPPAPGGSVWDRIRGQSSAGGNASDRPYPPTSQQSWSGPRGSSGQATTSGQGSEGYSYPPAEEEKNYAKEQAQKEFDAMLERERRGEPEGRGRRF